MDDPAPAPPLLDSTDVGLSYGYLEGSGQGEDSDAGRRVTSPCP